MTLREIKMVIDGSAERLKLEHNNRAWLAWHTASLTAYAPQKSRDFTRLSTLLMGAGVPRRQTADEQIHIARQWTAALQRK